MYKDIDKTESSDNSISFNYDLTSINSSFELVENQREQVNVQGGFTGSNEEEENT